MGKSMIFCYNTKIMLMQKPSKADHHSPKRSSLRITLFLDVFLLLTITVIATAVGGFFLAQSEISLRAELQQTVQSKQELLASTIAKQREQISIIGQSETSLSIPLRDSIGFDALVYLDGRGDLLEANTGTESDIGLSPSILARVRSQNQPSFFPIIEKNMSSLLQTLVTDSQAEQWLHSSLQLPSVHASSRQSMMHHRRKSSSCSPTVTDT